MGYDSLPTSHAISIPVNVPEEISEIFDIISYRKGSCVIRMMANFLDFETFIRGIANYLHAKAYSNADQDQLWEFLTAAAQENGTLTNLTVKQVMDTWTVQMGYPVVKVQRDYASGGAMADQDRFLLTPADNKPDNANYTWWVPISWTTPEIGFDITSPTDWLDPAQAGTNTI